MLMYNVLDVGLSLIQYNQNQSLFQLWEICQQAQHTHMYGGEVWEGDTTSFEQMNLSKLGQCLF